ncbi:hypothetical protein [Nocardia paucivorans]|uniref:hypothetical protein n=1 Tax=Nocardia paucivorans TaxID=114259 RepID=UPI0002FBDB34|nr:hypothetical protein [Nocardia paucivorans]
MSKKRTPSIGDPLAEFERGAPKVSESPQGAAKPTRLTVDIPPGLQRLMQTTKGKTNKSIKTIVLEALAGYPPLLASLEGLIAESRFKHHDIDDPRQALAAEYPDVAEFLATVNKERKDPGE